jgi:alpha/beta superfamily hydrolase
LQEIRLPSTLPSRPSAREEQLSTRLFLALSPSLARVDQQPPPPELTPWELVTVPRTRGQGTLAATWYPAPAPVRGAVLMLPPWTPWGRSYFHRRGRIEALRAAGYHALTVDFPGFGGSGPPAGLFDRDVEDALTHLRRQTGALPLHVWGVSSGGAWAHIVLARCGNIAGAVFEDALPHPFSWSWRTAPLRSPAYLFFKTFFRATYHFLDTQRYAAALCATATAYISGDLDPGIRPEETAELARLTRGRSLIVRGAGHLSSIRAANAEVLDLALNTFRRAEALTAA